MGVFSRLLKVGQAKANQIVDNLEKPEIMLEQAILDQEKQIRQAKANVQQVIATERQTKALLDKEGNEKTNWEERAKAALKANEETLATKALQRSEEHEKKMIALQPTWEVQRKDVESLKQDIQKMENELAELKRDKDIIVAQSKAAEVKKTIYEAKAKIGKNSTADLIARMKAKSERQNFEAQAAKELLDVGGDSLEKDFEKIERSATTNQSIQNKLESMKKEIEG